MIKVSNVLDVLIKLNIDKLIIDEVINELNHINSNNTIKPLQKTYKKATVNKSTLRSRAMRERLELDAFNKTVEALNSLKNK